MGKVKYNKQIGTSHDTQLTFFYYKTLFDKIT